MFFDYTPFMETSLIGQFESSKAYLASRLGEPTICNDHIPSSMLRQSLYTWAIRTAYGPVMIYDYKEWEDPDFADDKVITWQVGGRSKSYTARRAHPINQWVSDRIGLAVSDRRPTRHRPGGGNAHQLTLNQEVGQ